MVSLNAINCWLIAKIKKRYCWSSVFSPFYSTRLGTFWFRTTGVERGRGGDTLGSVNNTET